MYLIEAARSSGDTGYIAVASSPDGKTIVSVDTGYPNNYSVYPNSHMRVWDAGNRAYLSVTWA